MLKYLKFTYATFLVFFLISIFTKAYCQDKQDKKNIETVSDYDLDKIFKPSSSKYAIENQINEIKEIIKQKQREIEFLENFEVAKLDTTNRTNFKSINQEWKDIKSELNGSSPNFKSLAERANSLIQRFYPLYSGTYYSRENQPLIITKITQIFSQKFQALRERLNIGYFAYRSPDYEYTKSDIESIINNSSSITDSTYKIFSELYTKLIEEEKEFIKLKIDERKSFVDKAYSKIEELNKVSEDKDISINQKAITIGLPWFCVTVIVLFGFTFLYKKIYSNNSSSNTPSDDENSMSKVLLEVITVLLITLTVLILGLARIITENVLGTLLGGIAGYILNRNKK